MICKEKSSQSCKERNRSKRLGYVAMRQGMPRSGQKPPEEKLLERGMDGFSLSFLKDTTLLTP